MGSFCRQAALEVQADGPEGVSLLLLDSGRLFLLPRLQKPLVVVVLERLGLGMVVALGNTDGVRPTVSLGVHGDRLVHPPLADVDVLGIAPALAEDGKPCLDLVAVGAIAARLHRVLRGDIVEHVEVPGLGDVSYGGKALLGNLEVVYFQRLVAELVPLGLRLGRELERLQDLDRPRPVLLLAGRPKLDQALVQGVAHGVDPLVDDDLRLPPASLDVCHLPLDGEHGLVVRLVNGVPHAEVASVLRDHDVAVGHPLHVGAVGEEGDALLRLDVVKVEVLLLVPEQEVGRAGVELQPVDARVVVDGCQGEPRHEVEDADGLQVDEVRNLLVLLDDAPLLVQPDADEVRAHVLGPAGPEDFASAVLDQSQLPSVVDHAHLGAVKDELLRPGPAPGDLAQLAGLQVAHQEGVGRVGDEEAVLLDVDSLDLVAERGLEHDPGIGCKALDDDLALGHVGELKLPLVPLLAEAGVVEVDASTEAADGEPRAVRPPGERGDRVEVLDLLGADFLPDAAPGIEAVYVESVERADDNGLAARIELRGGELSDVLVVGVVKSLQDTAVVLVENNLGVTACSAEALAPREGVGDAGVLRKAAVCPAAPSRVKGEAVQRAVEVPRDDAGAVKVGSKGYHIGLLWVCI
mmetsp:Transcript_38799/g.91879  ORF Transcript_38799/g.91879 Transcript_38799/m.91879 type:complete len:635 (-) Transcript_38799:696-2600(-)